MRVKLTNFKNDYDNDNEPADKFKKLDPRRAELAGKNALHIGMSETSLRK